ncbi:TonB-dependent receptor [Shewanella sp. VB17]|uniref:TonB-dependent receptor plug domain-containing protein n=1 Tax=Shewanella sp. VB17 TaxID=2739432 RepID=UPI0015661A5A|nr:TonB-dependent receptor [Shewanella sp. VB17]NRD74328.1 TonB-dependent receptor [Shewanella sp. VB17]
MLLNSTIAKAIRYSLITSAAAATALTAPAVFAANEDEKVERISVTGSRIKRTDMETALPITVLSSEDIAKTGLNDISAVLAQMPYNTGGSFISDAGSSASNHASSGMRGLDSSRTLTLINGRRIAPSASLGDGATNLNLIPMEAIERIEILRDGASAIYGSDAIGGVINIILKKSFDGLALGINMSNPTQGDRDEKSATLTFGSNSDKSTSLIVIEHKDFDSLQGGSREHLSANWDEGYARSQLYAPEGTYRPVPVYGGTKDPITGKKVYTGDYVAGKDCPADRIVNNEGTRCGWNYYDGKDYLPEQTKDSLFTNMTYNISDEIEWFGQAIIMRDKSITASTSLYSEDLYMTADNPNNPTRGTADVSDIQVFHRLTDVADRETAFESNVIDFVTGINLELEAGSLNWYVQYSDQNVDITTNSYVFNDELQVAVDTGRYNPFVRGGNATQETLTSFLHTATRKAETTTTGTSLSWASELPLELHGGTIGYAVGAEYQKMEYSDKRDAQQSNEDLIGTYGGDAAGERSYKAAYVEVDIPVLSNVTVKLASRYDEYSIPDEGQVSSSINVRYEVVDSLVLRASYGQGFRAPALDALFSEKATSYGRVTDTKSCQALPQADRKKADVCKENSYLRTSTGNLDLEPEESDQYSFGGVWNIVDDVSLSLDYYNIQISNQVNFLDEQAILDLEASSGLDAYDPNTIFVKRNAAGEIEEIGAGFINMAGVETSGIDISFKSQYELADYGTLNFGVEGTYALTFTEQDSPIAERYDVLGSKSYPPIRVNASFGYSYGAITASLLAKYIDAYDGETAAQQASGINKQDFASSTIWDLSLTYDMDNYGRASIGARNLFDAMPNVNYELGYPGYDDNTHNITGRVIFAGYKIQF